ncbi:MAG: Uncharacterized protein FD130_812 [Halothiobacillaceae bacterium]|nr:MAG: Uncharacterized protein FD130_812 [Halothiobacillaceae bacterium]
MNGELHREKLCHFLATIWRSDTPIHTIDEQTSLIDAGLIDSLAILQIITFLESEFKIDFFSTDTDPTQLDSVAAILDLIKRYAA